MKEHLNVDMLLNQKDELFSSTVVKKTVMGKVVTSFYSLALRDHGPVDAHDPDVAASAL